MKFHDREAELEALEKACFPKGSENDCCHYTIQLEKGTLSVIALKANPATAFNILETLKTAHKKINLYEAENKLIMISKKRIRIIT